MILRIFGGEKQDVIPQMGEGVIIISADLSPADTAQMKMKRYRDSRRTSAGKPLIRPIVARSIEIPAVVWVGEHHPPVRTNDLIIIDGSAGLVIVNPDPEIVRRYEVKKRHYEETREMSLIDAVLLPSPGTAIT